MASRYIDLGEQIGSWAGSLLSSWRTKPCDLSGAKATRPVYAKKMKLRHLQTV